MPAAAPLAAAECENLILDTLAAAPGGRLGNGALFAALAAAGVDTGGRAYV